MGWKIVTFGAILVIGGCLTAAALELKPGGASSTVAEDFQLQTTRGKSVRLSDYRGKVVVLDFWASWCPPCRAAIPVLDRIYQENKDRGVVVLGVNVKDDKDPAQTMSDLGASYPALVGGDAVAERYGVEALPTILVVGPSGKIVYREKGFTSIMEQRIGEVLEKELAKAD